MAVVAARQHPIVHMGRGVGAGLALVGLAALVAAYALPLAVPHIGGGLSVDSANLRILSTVGRLFAAVGVVTAVLAMLLDRLIPIPSAAIGRTRKVEDEAPAAAPPDLSAAPEAIRELLAAARQRGYEVANVAPWSKALVVHMTAPLAPEDRQQLIQDFPTLGRWFFSGDPQTPPDEGFRDAQSGVSISFPAPPASAERSSLQRLESAEGAELGSRAGAYFRAGRGPDPGGRFTPSARE